MQASEKDALVLNQSSAIDDPSQLAERCVIKTKENAIVGEAWFAGNVTAVERLAFERLLADLSARFASISGEQLASEIHAAIKEIREFLGFDRSSFGEFQADGSFVVVSSDAAPGFDTVPLGKFDGLPWYLKTLREGQGIVLQLLPDDLPPEAVAEAEYVRRSGLRSNLSIPLRVGWYIGVITLTAFSEKCSWPSDVIDRLSLVGRSLPRRLNGSVRKRHSLPRYRKSISSKTGFSRKTLSCVRSCSTGCHRVSRASHQDSICH